jgi:hypothetical protein
MSKKLHKVEINGPLFGDITRAPSDAENEAALKAKGWAGHMTTHQAAGVSLGTNEQGDTMITAEPPPPRRVNRGDEHMRRLGFRDRYGRDQLSPEDQMRQIISDIREGR